MVEHSDILAHPTDSEAFRCAVARSPEGHMLVEELATLARPRPDPGSGTSRRGRFRTGTHHAHGRPGRHREEQTALIHLSVGVGQRTSARQGVDLRLRLLVRVDAVGHLHAGGDPGLQAGLCLLVGHH
ncbi:MAG: hypothetical protein ACRDUV_24110, partial [Pseudonocardiaceae bacterium]